MDSSAGGYSICFSKISRTSLLDSASDSDDDEESDEDDNDEEDMALLIFLFSFFFSGVCSAFGITCFEFLDFFSGLLVGVDNFDFVSGIFSLVIFGVTVYCSGSST